MCVPPLMVQSSTSIPVGQPPYVCTTVWLGGSVVSMVYVCPLGARGPVHPFRVAQSATVVGAPGRLKMAATVEDRSHASRWLMNPPFEWPTTKMRFGSTVYFDEMSCTTASNHCTSSTGTS